MNKMPLSLRKRLEKLPRMKVCARQNGDCDGRITWEHSMYFAGKSLQDDWAIVALCWFHHLGKGMDKRENQRIALQQASIEELKKYPRTDWLRQKQQLQ